MQLSRNNPSASWKLAFRIARRYLFSSRLPRALNLISAITVGGIGVGTALLVVVLSVFNGFYYLIRDHYEAFDADLKISAARGQLLRSADIVLKAVANHPDVLAYSPALESQAIMRFGEQQHIVTLKGVARNYRDVTDIAKLVRNGTYGLKTAEGDYTLVLGAGVAWRLGVNLADWLHPIEAFTLSDKVDPTSADPEKLLNRQYFFPAGVFSIEKDYDSRYVICDIEAARTLFDATGGMSSIEIKARSEDQVESLKRHFKKELGEDYRVESWYEQHATLNAVLQNEKAVGYLIILFMLLLISFNIVGTLSMTVIAKQKEIAILRTLGGSEGLIQRVFLLLGLMMGGLGTASGLALGAAFCFLQDSYGLLRFDVQDTATMLVDHFPVRLLFSDLAAIAATVLLLSFAAAWLPARRAAGRSILHLLRSR